MGSRCADFVLNLEKLEKVFHSQIVVLPLETGNHHYVSDHTIDVSASGYFRKKGIEI